MDLDHPIPSSPPAYSRNTCSSVFISLDSPVAFHMGSPELAPNPRAHLFFQQSSGPVSLPGLSQASFTTKQTLKSLVAILGP